MTSKILLTVGILAGAMILTSAFTFNQEDERAKSIARGKEIYTELCVTCHQVDGKGMDGAFPPLAQSDFLLKNSEKAISAVKFGLQGEIIVNGKTYSNTMPNPGLSNQEVADVINYILNSWENKGTLVGEEDVAAVKE